ncbi:MAG: hypothetical protein HGA90_07540 [Alphaproteobacteria bacterium]|nr:hypothetical protein [Alphaproteobacteria bacterium]
MDGSGDQVLIITGANMAGKSTYMRAVALVAIALRDRFTVVVIALAGGSRIRLPGVGDLRVLGALRERDQVLVRGRLEVPDQNRAVEHHRGETIQLQLRRAAREEAWSDGCRADGAPADARRR